MQLRPGDVAVVTGAASGIGLGLAEAFAGRGLAVVMTDLRADALEQSAATLRRQCGVDVLEITLDVRDPDAVAAAAERTVDRYGHVEIICNNAGVAPSPMPMWELPVSTWRWTLDVGLMGVVHGIRAFVPHLIAQGRGHVVNTASVGGLVPLPGMGPYSAVKHAVVGLTESLAVELRASAPGVGTSVLCPGLVDTDLPLTTRLTRPDTVPAQEAAGPDADVPTMAAQVGPGRTLMSREEVARQTVDAIESGRLHIITHADSRGPVTARVDAVLTDLL
jgi:NAD(P)-dependent dehydrogenase (short-subunit alcohol dehydrogenase family)